ncbi:MAG: LysR family transcriptional regulator, partial [Rhodobacterales bacterium 17-64-5]
MIRMDAVTLRQLRALLMVDRVGSMASAAKELRLTAPAVHSQIKGLEEALQAPVLSRQSDVAGSGLTDEGQVLADAMVRIDAILSQAAEQIAAMKAGQVGRVRLGVV